MSNVRENVEAGVEAMLEHMRDDYRGWSRSGEKDEYGHRAKMEEDYADNLHNLLPFLLDDHIHLFHQT